MDGVPHLLTGHHDQPSQSSLYAATLVSMGTTLGLGVVPVTSLVLEAGQTFFLSSPSLSHLSCTPARFRGMLA